MHKANAPADAQSWILSFYSDRAEHILAPTEESLRTTSPHHLQNAQLRPWFFHFLFSHLEKLTKLQLCVIWCNMYHVRLDWSFSEYDFHDTWNLLISPILAIHCVRKHFKQSICSQSLWIVAVLLTKRVWCLPKRVMSIHEYSWVFMSIHEYSWVFMSIHEYSWVFMSIHEYSWVICSCVFLRSS